MYTEEEAVGSGVRNGGSSDNSTIPLRQSISGEGRTGEQVQGTRHSDMDEHGPRTVRNTDGTGCVIRHVSGLVWQKSLLLQEKGEGGVSLRLYCIFRMIVSENFFDIS